MQIIQPRSTNSPCAGLTRIDVLVIVGSVCLLAFLQLSSVAEGKNKSQAAVCLANLESLGRAWAIYAADYNGLLPHNEDNASGGWVRGWMDYADSPDNTNIVHLGRSLLGRHVESIAVFKCPSDQSRSYGRNGSPRVRSYSMNAAVGPNRLGTAVGRGAWLPAPQYRVFTRMSEILRPHPAKLWVLIDEHPDSINDGSFAVQMADTIVDANWIDFPAKHHDESGALVYADGHAELHRWERPSNIPNVNYTGIGGQGPNGDPDCLWLIERTSSRSNQ